MLSVYFAVVYQLFFNLRFS